jgi:hypothetical protein
MLLITSPIISLSFKVKDNIIVIFANNPSAILSNIYIANATFGISSLTSCIFGTKATSLAKKGSIKRVNSKRS